MAQLLAALNHGGGWEYRAGGHLRETRSVEAPLPPRGDKARQRSTRLRIVANWLGACKTLYRSRSPFALIGADLLGPAVEEQ
jgi:hypothetical protein